MHRAVTTFPFLLLALAAISEARAQDFVWAKQLSGTGYDWAVAVATDASGSVFTAGGFQGRLDFDPGPGTYYLTVPGGPNSTVYDVFVSKLDRAGNFVFAKQVGAGGWDRAYDVALDASGNIHTVGIFEGTVDFDPGAGTYFMNSWQGEAFVLKLDSVGDFVWAKQLGTLTIAEGVAVDVDGNVYTVGYFQNTADFDPGPGVYNLVASGSSQDAFISKLDAAGDFVWAKQLGGTSDELAYDVAVDAGGDVCTVGRFSGTADFDPGPGTYNLTAGAGIEAFVSKLDSTGNFVWARKPGVALTAYAVAVDGSGAMYVVGISFVSKLSATGSVLWTKPTGGGGLGAAVDVGGNVYTVGNFSGTRDFDPGPGTYYLTAAGVSDACVSKLDSAGNFLWARQLGGTGTAEAHAVAVDRSGSVCTVGRFWGTADYDPGPSVYNLTSGGFHDAFISKLAPAGAGAVPDGSVVSGVPLTIGKAAGTQLDLAWGLSCNSGDMEYEVYEGTLGTFSSHVPLVCSTGGATSATIVPSSGDRYYLVVPATASAEGSYGTHGSGLERPASASACLPQSVRSCP